MWRADSLEKTLMLGQIEGRRRREQQRMRWLDGITDLWVWVNSGSWWWTGRPGMLRFMGSQRVGHNWATKLNWPDELFWQVSIFLLLSSIYSFNLPWWILWLNVTWDSLLSRISSTVQLCIIKYLFSHFGGIWECSICSCLILSFFYIYDVFLLHIFNNSYLCSQLFLSTFVLLPVCCNLYSGWTKEEEDAPYWGVLWLEEIHPWLSNGNLSCFSSPA